MLLKGALHVHTTCSDGNLIIEEAIEVYKNLGFDFIALTDHDFLYRKGCYDDVEKRAEKYIRDGFIIFKGIEVTVFEKGYVHINKVEGVDEVLHIFNHPSEMDLPVEKAIERIKTVAKKNDPPVDAVEITSKGFYTPEYDIPEIPYPKVATDDSHTREGCGRAWIELDCKREKDEIIRAVKAGDFWNCFSGNQPGTKKQNINGG